MKTAKEIVKSLSLREKAAMCTGLDFWHTRGIPGENIPPMMVSDGPHGLRKQSGKADHLGLNASQPATCFPSASALAASFDPSLAERMGTLLGELAADEDVGIVLGPGVNLKRSPLCGRNFEYFSEDPLLTAEMAAGEVRGLQSQNVGACPKHFLANNQEHFRMTSNSVVDERALRELYLAAFEKLVKETNPWSLMCAYNRINGIYACENSEFLRKILKDEWKYDGFVVTDWGALDDPAASLAAGLDLIMPGPDESSVDLIVSAVEAGTVKEDVLDEALERLITVMLRYLEHKKSQKTYDLDKAHEAAREIETQCAVLLKNEDNILPLKSEESVVFIGEFAKAPRYQGGGSSHINAYKVSGAWDVVQKYPRVTFAEDASAVEAAKSADKAVIFAGLTDANETEGLDRKTLRLPESQCALIEAVAAVQPNTVVVLHNGSPVEMPWLDKIKGLLEMYLGGEAVGEAAADLLYGKSNPSGRLAETFPLRLEDTPAYPYYGTEREDVIYRESIMIGYRHYATRKIPVLFPFGYGLSYTSFGYSNLRLDCQNIKDTDTLHVSVEVTNTGKRDGQEVVQCYVSTTAGEVVRPIRELRAFEKVWIPAGETKTVTFALSKRAFAYWNVKEHDWIVESGTYEIQIGKNVNDIVCTAAVEIESTAERIPFFTVNTPVGDILQYPFAVDMLKEVLAPAIKRMTKSKQEKSGNDSFSADAQDEFSRGMPLRGLLVFSPKIRLDTLQQMVDEVNRATRKD